MKNRKTVRMASAAVACATLLALAGCADGDATANQNSSSGAGGGVVPNPDVNGDGKVVIGVLSPGDINDNGYYESFVTGAETFAKEKGWEIIKRGSVPESEALSAARALCQQKVDMVALGASELKDAIPASEEAVCEKTAWYVPSSGNVEQTPRIMLSTDDPAQSILSAGYATGVLMQQRNTKKAAFVAGMEVDFNINASKAFQAGIRSVIPDANVTTTYAGDQDDAAKAKEAVQAQIDQGVGAVYPYLGGSTDAATKLANTKKLITLTPGTDRCDSTDPKFDVSVLFSPGDYFTEALKLFADGKLEMGVQKVWTIGKDPYPTVKLCGDNPEAKQKIDAFMQDIASGKINASAEVERLGK
ncbi:BMP family ABC transporter substrate-binding protein [Actinomadura sp. 6K520]|uniref:BMP family ABC transporter substrate-binding protein n=1 Tax=Actinomadura sp. 6K520 TaxID=2530364 RepID=UPI001A9FB66F|nr:BMP family ABC transporter substrate-binding protein [Actinomadura sp. 6K520]